MQIDSSTRLFGIIGRPVGHSLSPVMHNAAFEHLGINAVYLAFETDSPGKAMEAVKTLGIRGLSITVPNKETVMGFLDEIHETARDIGAVNTVRNQHGRLQGINTDWIGAVEAIKAATSVQGSRVVVLGAGGSARAVIFGLTREGAVVHIANRTVEKAQRLADEFGCTYSGIEGLSAVGGDILINTTSVGMGSMEGVSPVKEEELDGFSLVMDIVYGRKETRLLKDARKHGCRVIPGTRMLLFQAVAQFDFWTGRKAPVNIMERALMAALAG